MARYELHGISFEWDERKAEHNWRQHQVAFESACEAFFDPFLRVHDATGEADEIRQGIIGLTLDWRFLHVVFVERGDVLRLVSARTATRAERKDYENQ